MKIRLVLPYLWAWLWRGIWTGVCMRIWPKWLRTARACGALRFWSPATLREWLWWDDFGNPRAGVLGKKLRNGTWAIARRYLRRAAAVEDDPDAAQLVREASRAADDARDKLALARRAVAASDPLRARREGFCTCVDGRRRSDCGIAVHRAEARGFAGPGHRAAHTWDGGLEAWSEQRLREHLEDWHQLTAPTADLPELRHLHGRVHYGGGGGTPLRVVRDGATFTQDEVADVFEQQGREVVATATAAADGRAILDSAVSELRMGLEELEACIADGTVAPDGPSAGLAAGMRAALEDWDSVRDGGRRGRS